MFPKRLTDSREIEHPRRQGDAAEHLLTALKKLRDKNRRSGQCQDIEPRTEQTCANTHNDPLHVVGQKFMSNKWRGILRLGAICAYYHIFAEGKGGKWYPMIRQIQVI